MNLNILAAGDGQRLRDEGVSEPKILLKVLGKTLLERVIDTAETYNFDTVNIIINEKFKNEVIDSGILSKHRNLKINCIYKSTLSSLHSLNELKKFQPDEPFCLMTIDNIYIESEFFSFLKSARDEDGFNGLIAVTDYVDDEKPLWVEINKDSLITKFSSIKGELKFVTGGIYFFKRSIFRFVEEAISKNISRLRNFFQYLVESGIKIKAVPFSKIIDLDHKSDLEIAERFLQESENPN